MVNIDDCFLDQDTLFSSERYRTFMTRVCGQILQRTGDNSISPNDFWDSNDVLVAMDIDEIYFSREILDKSPEQAMYRAMYDMVAPLSYVTGGVRAEAGHLNYQVHPNLFLLRDKLKVYPLRGRGNSREVVMELKNLRGVEFTSREFYSLLEGVEQSFKIWKGETLQLRCVSAELSFSKNLRGKKDLIGSVSLKGHTHHPGQDNDLDLRTEFSESKVEPVS